MIVRRTWPSRRALDSSTADLDQLRREVLRLFETATSADLGVGVFPPLNVTQDADNYYLRAEMPGMKSSELSISALRNRVTLAGKREIQREHERVSYHRKERPEGSFNRTVTLPAEIDAQRIDAKYANGILALTLPKADEAKPRQITVKT